MMWSVFSYVTAIQGEHKITCIESVLQRAMFVYLGTRKHVRRTGFIGDISWKPPLLLWQFTDKLYVKCQHLG